jgi:bifunctional DNase/RNase
MVEVYVSGMGIDPISQMPIVVLKSREDDSASLPIWIGVFEANNIVMNMQGMDSPRPMTYDLIKNILLATGYTVKMVTIDYMENNTYIATIHLQNQNLPDQELNIDSRPSDAINVALRFNAPIFVSKDLFNNVQDVEIQDDLNITEEDLKSWIENIKPEDFEKNP